MIDFLRGRSHIGMVAEDGERILGYMLYALSNKNLDLVSLAVHPKHRHKQIGRQMIERLIDKLSCQRREVVATRVRETNLDAQKFFSACGFKVVEIEREPFDESDEDGYRMEYRLREGVEK